MDLRGLGTALITPFDASGAVDYEALDRLLEIQLQGDVDYIVVLGTTGEAVTLTEEERRSVRQHIAQYVSGRLPLVLGLGGNCTTAVIATLKAMQDELISNYAAILSVCPYYNKPSQEGLYLHFSSIAQASPIPVILYNVPGRTGVNLLPETVMRIYNACPERILGIKEASGNIEQIKTLITMAKDTDLLVISGDDALACQVMEAGGAGLISVASNAWPKELVTIVRHKNHALQERFVPMINLLFKEGNPSGIKTVLAQQGLICNVLRSPLVPNSPAVQDEIATARRLLSTEE